MNAAPKFAPVVDAAEALIDIATLTGDEEKLVRACFEHYTIASQAVIEALADLAIPVPRARRIILANLLTIAGVDAHEQQIGTVDFVEMARHARRVAAEAVEVGIDIEGGMQ